MRVAVLVAERTPNAAYRAFMPMDALARRGHVVGTAVLERPEQLMPVEAFEGFDAVYIWRMYFPPIRRLVRALQARGIAVVWDNDDNMAAVPRGTASFAHSGGVTGQRMWAEIQSMVRLADAVTTPSPALAEKYRAAGQEHVEIVENYVPPMRAGARLPSRMVTVGWVAAGEHSIDVRRLGLARMAQDLLGRRGDVRVHTVGVALGIRHARYERTPQVAFEDLGKVISQFDVGLAPLADIEFNRSRSSIKVKEYAAMGVPWLASAVGPYLGLGEEQGGLLVADDEWPEAVSRLVGDEELRRRLARNARAWARTQTIEGNVERWERVLQEAVARVRSGERASA